jgi:hypothetical protein
LGVLLAVVAVGMDSIDPSTWGVSAERLEQSLEEVIELGSGLALLAAVLCRPSPRNPRPIRPRLLAGGHTAG